MSRMTRLKVIETSDGKELPVFDAKRAMKLHVGERELNAANRKTPNSCALAHACMAKEGVKEVRIHLSRAYVRLNDINWTRYFVSDNLRNEIIAFDRGGRFMPGEYVLQKISPSQRLTGKAAGSKKNKTNKNRDYSRKRVTRKPTQDVRLGPA